MVDGGSKVETIAPALGMKRTFAAMVPTQRNTEKFIVWFVRTMVHHRPKILILKKGT